MAAVSSTAPGAFRVGPSTITRGPASARMMKRRYSEVRASPSSKTTIEATIWVPCTWLTSKHSMRSGASASPSASCSSRQRQAARGEVTGPGELVPRQRLLGVLTHGLHERALVAALRHPHLDRGSAVRREPCRHPVRVARQHRDEHFLGDRFGRLVAVDLLQQVLDQAALRLRAPVDDPPALATHAPAPDVEDLDGRLELVLGQGKDVGVGGVAEHDGVLLQRLGQGLQVVAQPAARSNSNSAAAPSCPARCAGRTESCCRP
jgi:hypothetical protein